MRFTGVLSALLAMGCAATVTEDGADGAVPAPADASPPPPQVDAGPPPPVQMYAHTATDLYTIDDQDFALNSIGAFGNGDDITDLAVTPDGTLYGISNTKLYTIDRATGAATYAADVPGLSNVGLTFLRDGTLLATDKDGGVRRIDPSTGLVTEIGAFGSGYATAGDLVAVADGTMFAISDDGPSGDEYDNNLLITVDTDSGVGSPIGQIGYGGVFGCAYANGKVYAFARTGEIIEIDRMTGQGTLVKSYPVEFWGAGVTPLVEID